MSKKVICIGSVLWDVIGRTQLNMRVGSDVPGRITRIPGGVAMNIAMTLANFGLQPVLLSAVGLDREGDELIEAAKSLGLRCEFLHRDKDLPTDVYMAIEGANGVIAAIADAHSLEAAGRKIIAPVTTGAIELDCPVVLDGNLTEEMLQWIATDEAFSNADLRVAPASPGKAVRLRSVMAHSNATLYVNLEEACLLCGEEHKTAASAATDLVKRGAYRALVTDGANSATEASDDGVCTLSPPQVNVVRLTGAGDTFMAAHIASELQGMTKDQALARALNAAATFVSGVTPQ